MTNSTLSIPASVTAEKLAPSAAQNNGFSKKRRGIVTLPGLTGPVILVTTPRAAAVRKGTFLSDILSLAVDILDLRSWRDMDPLACFMLAGYAAVIAQPFVFGSLGSSIVALMTPLK